MKKALKQGTYALFHHTRMSPQLASTLWNVQIPRSTKFLSLASALVPKKAKTMEKTAPEPLPEDVQLEEMWDDDDAFIKVLKDIEKHTAQLPQENAKAMVSPMEKPQIQENVVVPTTTNLTVSNVANVANMPQTPQIPMMYFLHSTVTINNNFTQWKQWQKDKNSWRKKLKCDPKPNCDTEKHFFESKSVIFYQEQ